MSFSTKNNKLVYEERKKYHEYIRKCNQNININQKFVKNSILIKLFTQHKYIICIRKCNKNGKLIKIEN